MKLTDEKAISALQQGCELVRGSDDMCWNYGEVKFDSWVWETKDGELKILHKKETRFHNGRRETVSDNIMTVEDLAADNWQVFE